MKYMGSKVRFSKEILPIILEKRKENQWYFEPFAGGMNIIDKVPGKRIANDKNHYLIEMWKGLINGNIYPEDIPKSLYDEVRDFYNKKNTLKHFTDDFVGWIGFMGSANGRFFDGGYSGKTKTKIGTERDYISESIKNIFKQIPSMKGVHFFSKNYYEFDLKEPCLIYCDPPYKGTKQYSTSKDFDHERFWDWCREMSLNGHDVFISEYNAPDDFLCVWEKETSSSLRSNDVISGNKISTEKLFVYKKK